MNPGHFQENDSTPRIVDADISSQNNISETPQTYVLALAVEVRQCPLQVEPEGGKVEAEAGGGMRRRAAPLIKSRDPHLAGGEKPSQLDMESPCKPVVDFSCKH
jgi:hypothetical protein